MDKLYTGILLSALIFSSVITETQTASCCLSYAKWPIHCRHLKGYTIQTIFGSCDLNAIIFRTRNDKYICANPTVTWTQKTVRCLMERVKNMKHGPI